MNRITEFTVMIFLVMFACNAQQRQEDDFETAYASQYIGELSITFPEVQDSLECKREEFDALIDEARRLIRKNEKRNKVTPITLEEILRDTTK